MLIYLFPLELVRIIVGHVLLPDTGSELELGVNDKPSASLFHALSLASRTYRTLALEAWFRVLFLKSPADLLFLEHNLREVRTSWKDTTFKTRKTVFPGTSPNLRGCTSTFSTPHFPFFTNVSPTVAARRQ
ncbi:hypothetical protein C8J57DRAFT_1728822 [Mycena rebaudengoi]|nr:hypothetical protein C8J57DRAFT_1728822 [Mycena rebaudengoi]